jgi:hypothetical protein
MRTPRYCALLFILSIFMLANCRGLAPQSQTNTNGGASNNGNSSSANGNVNSANAINRTAQGDNQSAANVAGRYNVTGRNQNGTPYRGTLTITARGPVFNLAWQTGQNYEGTGIAQPGSLAVGWGGATCTVASYRILPDGTLEGQWTTVGQEGLGTERATRTGGAAAGGGDIAGNYTVAGSGPNVRNAGNYTGTLTITQRGSVYQFSWNTQNLQFEGIGIRQGNTVAVGWGTGQCGVVNYQIEANNNMRGIWGVYGQNQTGSEEAVRQ